MTPNISNLVLGEDVIGGDELDTKLLRQMNEEAKSFLFSFDWCNGIRRCYFGDGFGGIVAAFLLEIIPARADVDTWLWVIVGDVPPAYLVTDDIDDAAEAIRAYVELMREWVRAVENGKSVDLLIPVNVLPTQEAAASLSGRLDAIEKLGLYAVA